MFCYAVILRYLTIDLKDCDHIWLNHKHEIQVDTICPTKKECIKSFGWMLKSTDQIPNFYSFHISKIKVESEDEQPISSWTWDDKTTHMMALDGKFQKVYLSGITQKQHLEVNKSEMIHFLTRRQSKFIRRILTDDKRTLDRLTKARLLAFVYKLDKEWIESHPNISLTGILKEIV